MTRTMGERPGERPHVHADRVGETARAVPRVSIALSMHNSAATIAAALSSLQQQTFKDWELILIDDGSTDDSVQRALRCVDARAHLVADGRRLGLAARLNQAMEMARGPYLARMDADDIAYPERFGRQVEFLDVHSQVDLLGTGMLVFGDGGRPLGLFPVRARHEEICAKPWSGFYLPHPTWMGRLRWFRQWRYDSECRKAQDQDLLLRAYASSTYAALPEPLVGYRQERLSISKAALGRFYFSRAIGAVAVRDEAWLQGAGAIVAQALKLAVDTFAIGTGLSQRLLAHRVLPFNEATIARWQQVWASCAACAG